MSASPAAALREAGLRVTNARLEVLQTVQQHPHADAATVLTLTRERARGVSVQGVYDVLGTLTDAGLLRRIQPAHSVARFEIDDGDNHHHVVCRSCEAIVDVPCAVGERPCLDPAAAAALGFEVDEAEIIYWGTCPACREDRPATALDTPA
ncbi:Fur family transcriptional regulator [Ornithinimicrobium sufpigmenti]|uniref:Fur family transcriptional regulator n=1 Tax=Ornithinimicrobium sufpigmenti TaxID=2508882 RepID=UPI001035DCDF|nr:MULTISPECIES: Fur family transcriptional regulator [unclassified Ornithinimicrobium]